MSFNLCYIIFGLFFRILEIGQQISWRLLNPNQLYILFYIIYLNMIWTIIIQIIFTLIVIAGVLYLKSSKLEQNNKINILIIVGILLSISSIISAFKQKRYITFSLLNYHLNQCESKFTILSQEYQHKFKNLAKLSTDNTNFYKSNYKNFGQFSHTYQQKMIILSKKYQGASMFLYQLAKSIHKQSIPAFYVKFSFALDNQFQIADEMDIPSIRILQDIVYNWNKKGLNPYLIIDGLQFVSKCQKFMETLKHILSDMKVNFIANIQNRNSLQRIFNCLDYREIIIKQWQQPTKQFMSSIKENIYFKKLPKDFKTLSYLMDLSQEQLILKKNSLYKQMANHFEIKELIKQINNQKNSLKVSKLKKMMSPQEIKKLQKYGIIHINKGIVTIAPNGFIFTSDL